MEIKLLPNLAFSPSGLISYHDRRLSEENRHVHLRQGDLDGACGPYALMMAMLAYGAITRKDAVDLWLGKLKSSTKVGKVISNLDALLRDGTDAKHLKALFEATQAYSRLNGLACNGKLQNLRISETKDRGQQLFKTIYSSIDKGFPLILCLEWGKNDAHWVVAVGYQSFKKTHDNPLVESKLETILVLDPGASFSTTSAWNGVLSVQPEKGALPFQYWTNDFTDTQCDADGGLSFSL